MGREGLAASVPPGRSTSVGGAATRAGSTRRRLEYDGGTGVSPTAKRPAMYVTPVPVQGAAVMDTQMLSNEVMTIKQAIDNMHAWVTSIADASLDHATQVEAASKDLSGLRAEMTAFAGQLAQSHTTADSNVQGVFHKVDMKLGELKLEMNSDQQALKDTVTQVEAAFRRLEASMQQQPPGLQPSTSSQPSSGQEPLQASVQQMQSLLDQLAGRLQSVQQAVTHVTTEVGHVQGRVRDIEARQQLSGGDPWQQGGPGGAGKSGTTTGAPPPPQGQGAAAHQGATWHNMASDGPSQTGRRERAPYDDRWNFDNKLAKESLFHYDQKSTAAWLKKVSNYFVGQCPDAELLLKWAQDHQNTSFSQTEVKNCGLALDADPVQVSQRIWSWLHRS